MSKSYQPIFLDFEFNGTTEAILNLVSCATFDPNTGEKIKWWLHKNPKGKERLKEYLQRKKYFYAHAVVAEARAFISLGLDPLDFEWADSWLEWRMLTNHNDKLQYGKQLVDGRVRFFKKPLPKWQRAEGEKAAGFKPTHSLAELTYKLTGRIRDTKEKEEIRNLIISAPEEFTDEQRKKILDYNMDDVADLPDIAAAIEKEFFSLRPKVSREEYIREMKLRGRYSAHTAWMEHRGYPINVLNTRNFSRAIPSILFDIQREINRLFPDIKPFKWNRRENRFSWNQKRTKEWIEENHDVERWMKTKKKQISLALEAWERFYDFKHDYPKDNFGAQMVRFLKLKQAIYGFAESKGPKAVGETRSFWDYVGSDGRVRPFLNIYGAQSSRSQPAAKGFMFLKPAWMRALVEPKRGRFLAGIDYGAQEFLGSALCAEDRNMIDAYHTGDPYLALAKLVKAVPQTATKESHSKIRDRFKTIVLGISYLMSKYGLAIKLTADTGEKWSEEDAQDQIDMFYEAFWKLKEFQEDLIYTYQDEGFIKLPCGWYMWGDNDNHRSVTNVPIQGLGASVMRKAVDLAHARGIEIVFTLHDALYMEGKVGEEWKIEVLRDCMREAFMFYIPEHLKKDAAKIRLDPKLWGPTYKDGVMEVGKSRMKVPTSRIHIDRRALADYKRFSPYFLPRPEDCL